MFDELILEFEGIFRSCILEGRQRERNPGVVTTPYAAELVFEMVHRLIPNRQPRLSK